MAMPLTERNLAICVDCRDCIEGFGCRYVQRGVSFKPQRIPQNVYYKSWYQENQKRLKAKRSKPLEKMKARAHEAVKLALRTGDLLMPSKCVFCKQMVELVAHHPNYNEVLRVVWCCKSCHRKLHAAMG